MPRSIDAAPAPRRALGGVAAIARDPFRWAEPEIVEIKGPTTLADLVRGASLDPRAQPVIAQVDGVWVLQRDWPARPIGALSMVVVMALPQGGGGGGGGAGKSSLALALAIAATIATSIVAPMAGAFVATSLGFAASGIAASIATAVVGAAIAAGSAMLINAIVPPNRPQEQTRGGFSPTYTLSARGNHARIGDAIPVLYGRHIVYPDFAASPWQVIINEDQYLNQVLLISQGEVEIERIAYGETPITDLADITYEVVGPGGTITLFNPHVYVAPEVGSGIRLKAPNENGGGAAFSAGDDIDPGDPLPAGPFPACPPGKVTANIDVLMAFPGGIGYTNDTGANVAMTMTWTVEARKVTDDGVPIGGWITVATTSRAEYTTITRRQMNSYVLPEVARWQVRVTRTNDFAAISSARNEMVWIGLQGRMTGGRDLGDVTVLVIRARATDQIHGAMANQLNVLATRKLPIWNGTSWSAPTATRSIAWAAADLLRNTTYGAGLAEARIDKAWLLAVASTWATRGDTFDAVFDTSQTVWDALQVIMRAGRAKPFYQGGVVRFHRDAEQTLPVAMFSPRNMVQGSFKLEFGMPVVGETADGVEVEYMSDLTWRTATVIRGVAGATPSNPARERLMGVVGVDQATREAEYMAAANRYRRVFASFTTELDALVVAFGDLIAIAHDVPRWGQAGRVVAWDAATRTVRLAPPISAPDAATLTLQFRTPTGAVSDVVAVTTRVDATTLVLAEAPELDGTLIEMVVTGAQEPTTWMLGWAGQETKRALVTGIQPRGDRVEVMCVLEDDRVHVN